MSRDDLQRAFDRYHVRYSKAEAARKLTAACGTGEVAKVPDDKIAAGFKALAISPAVLNACGVPPLTVSKFPSPKGGQSAQARLGEMAKAIYSVR